MSEMEQELARLREQVAQLEAEKNKRVDHNMNAGLQRVAAHASREAQQYRQIQATGEAANIEVSEAALDAASVVMADMGLL